jgi:1-acyl-sn-glycerol-3-phosphate acyltransferase
MEILKKIGRVIISTVIIIYCKIVYRLKVVGLENVPKEGAVIFCGNHRTYLDPPAIVVTAGRHMRFLAKEELRKNPLFAFLKVVYDGIYVKRDAKDITAMKEAMKTLKEGGCVGMFPEGTRNGLEKNDGKMKSGACYMALKTNAKIVPIGIQGEAKPFKRTTLVYGKPIDFSEKYNLKEDKEAADKATEELRDAIVALTKVEV